MSICDKACDILRATADGESLDPRDLLLVEMAVNDNLNELGLEAFEKLYTAATSTEGYRKPWFAGVEHLTINNQGYVLWRGKIVEHYSFRYAYSEEGQAAAVELGEKCRAKEASGATVTMAELFSGEVTVA